MELNLGKLLKIFFALFAFFTLISIVYSIQINEVESNPAGNDAGQEWIEFYSKQEVNLSEYKITNNDGQEMQTNAAFSGYYVLNLEKQWLDNSNEKVILMKDGKIIDETLVFSDSTNNGNTWNFCTSWILIGATKGAENNCPSNNPKNNEDSDNKTREDVPLNLSLNDSKNDSSSNASPEYVDNLNANNPVQEIIYLSPPQTIKNPQNNEVLFRSKNEKIKLYAYAGFAVFCALIMVFLLLSNKLNKPRNYEEI